MNCLAALSFSILTSTTPAGELTATADRQWSAAGIAQPVSAPVAQIGTDADGTATGLILPFRVPALNGWRVTGAELSVTVASPAAAETGHLDVYGVRSSHTSDQTIASDYDNGLVVVDDWIALNPSLPPGTHRTAHTNLAEWIAGEVGTTGDTWIFLALRPDTPAGTNLYAALNTADAPSGKPKLTLTLSSLPAPLDISANAGSILDVQSDGTVRYPGTEMRAGRPSIFQAGIMAFDLPDLEGAPLKNASLKFRANSAAWMNSTCNTDVNLEAVRSAPANSPIISSDYLGGLGLRAGEVMIQEQIARWNDGSFPRNYATDAVGAQTLTAWLTEQYKKVGAGGRVFLRLAPNHDPIQNYYFSIDTSSIELTLSTETTPAAVRGFGNTVAVKMGSHQFDWTLDHDVEWGYFIDGQPWVVMPGTGTLHLVHATPARLNNQTVYNYPSTETAPNPVTADVHITVRNPPVNNQYDPKGYLIDKRAPAGVWGWDSRPPGGHAVTDPPYNATLGWDGATPLALSAGDTITTPKSTTNVVMSDRSTKLDALATLTVLSAVPPKDTFRPGIFREGINRTNPEILRYSDLIDLSGKLIPSPIGSAGLNGTSVTAVAPEFSFNYLQKQIPGPGFINTGLAYTEGCSAFYNNNCGSGSDNSYGGFMGQRFGRLAVGSLAGWLTEDERKLCRIRLIQRAIDTYTAVNEGLCLEEGAGILPGYSTLITLAGIMLNHDGMKNVNNGVNGVPPWFVFADYATTFHTEGISTNDLSAGEQPEDRLVKVHPDLAAGDPCPGLNKTSQTGCVASTTANTMTLRDNFYWDYSRPMVNCINMKVKVTAGPGAGNTIYVITGSSNFKNSSGTVNNTGAFGYEYGGTVTVKPSWTTGNGAPPDSTSTLSFSVMTSHSANTGSDDRGRWLWAVNGIVDTASNPHIEKELCICTSPAHEYASIMAGGTIGNLIALYALDGQNLYKGGLDKWLIDAGTRPGYGEVLFSGYYLGAVQNTFLGALWRQEVLNHPQVNKPFVYTGQGTAALTIPPTDTLMWYESGAVTANSID